MHPTRSPLSPFQGEKTVTTPSHRAVSPDGEPASPTAAGPLTGIRVLDLTSVVLGPVATQILGDHGADIIKIEATTGDMMRANGAARNLGMSSIFLAINRNKRSLAVDLKTDEGRRIALEIAASVDIVIHNMRVPAMERLGLGYEAVKAVNPEVIYCAATGFGQDGPDRNKPAFDDIIQAACGLVGLVGAASGRPEYTPSLVADKLAGVAVSGAVLAALVHKARTGEGQYVEVPMYETLVEFVLAEHMGGMAFEPPAGPAGYARILSGGRRPSRTADGYVAMLPYSPKHWADLFAHLGHAAVLEECDIGDRFKVNSAVRMLYDRLNEITPARTTDEWLSICEELDIPATRIYNIEDLPDHPHLKAVGMFETMDHPSEGKTRFVRPAARFERTPMSVRLPAPSLGQHSRAVLDDLGYSAEVIEKLARDSVIYLGDKPPHAGEEQQDNL
nr:CoA transferase [Sphingopyxis sp. JAI108]